MLESQCNDMKAWARDNGVSADVPRPAIPPPVGKQLGELTVNSTDDPSELLRHRYLCRGGGLLLVGQTGVGKSSLAMQAMILWAIGRPLFGIHPVKPLKSLLIQAENDEGDLAEMRDGVIAGLHLSADERQRAMENVIIAREDERAGVAFFADVVGPLLDHYRPDLLWIDPVLAYLAGEFGSQKDVGTFLRRMLNPLLRKFDCAAVAVHHTNKPSSSKDKSDWSGRDFAYLAGGSAEWANWPRAVLCVRCLRSDRVFELLAAKRGSRLGWKKSDGLTETLAKMIAHTSEPGVIFWRDADESEVSLEAKPKRIYSKEDMMSHVPMDKPISKETLRNKANLAGIPINKINPLITELIDDGTLHESQKKRPGTNGQKFLSRQAQPAEELTK